jgi:phage terminase large subunit-like protein
VAKKREPKCRVEAYARSVVDGKVVVGRLVRLACDRHLNELETGKDRGLRFDAKAAQHAIDFCELLTHSKGEWAGTKLKLQPWQAFIVGNLFGWKRLDGTRRFRLAYHELARKNGKSTFAAAVGLLLAFFSGEPGAETYTAATKKDQARIVHEEAIRMVRASASLRKTIRIYRDNLSVQATNSKYVPLGADADTLDGLNPSAVIIDELHAHKTRAMLDVLDTATGARREPLLFIITTAGVGKETVCGQMHDYAVRVLEGTVQEDTTFAFVAGLDEGDDWQNEKCWPKANPNLNVSVKLDDLRQKCRKAKEMVAAQNSFRRLHLSEWCEQATRAIDLKQWDAGAMIEGHPLDPKTARAEMLERLRGQQCRGGLDLGSVSDLTALALLFGDDAAGYDLLPFFWVPLENARLRERRDRVPYLAWISQGFVRATEGNETDYQVVRKEVNDLASAYGIQELAVDRLFQGVSVCQDLARDGLNLTSFGQGFFSMAAPTRRFLELVAAGKIRHGGNPVLRWMAGNAATEEDSAGNLKFSKKKSSEKIDGLIAAVMALGVSMVGKPVEEPSVYEMRGILTIGGKRDDDPS